MHDARTRLLAQEGLGEEPHEVVALDELPPLVEEETAIVVAVPGESHIGTARAHRLGGGGTVFLQHGVRHAVREGAVGLVIDLDELERQVRLERSTMSPAPPLPALTTTLSARSCATIHVTEQVLEVLAADVERSVAPGACRLRREPPTFDERAHLLEAGVGADGARSLAHELHAVVVRRIVARGHHDPAIEPSGEGREVGALGTPEADIEHIGSAVAQAALHRRGERRARQADVVADRHALRLHERGVGAGDVVGE